ncbi:hypothetical protein G9F32_07030 [Acinetobacter sp. 194]|uniref:hypothetical protein n=1 Tax=Acinetobacter shaoyimingii TaxID=2715164 RepID=UPI001D0EF97E|nr:hypothetical protein [Acinetobacter shaoyimingii]NHB57785.1 hypothetical protein [Acinetobacter shaoyimingii]
MHQEPNLNSTQIMQNLRQKFESGEHQHEFFIASALKTVNFNNTFESFKRLDQMFDAFKKQVGKLDANFIEDPLKCNTIKLIASYMGQFICYKLGQPENWQSYAEMHQVFQSFKDKPNDFIHQYGINCNNQITLPLFYVVKHFCSDEHSIKISQEIENLIINNQILKINDTQMHSEEMHNMQTIYQKGYALFCETAFEPMVRASNLDYSLESLVRLDELMREIRTQYIQSPAQFLSKPKHFCFILYLAGYLGRVIAQECGCALRWYSSQQVSQMVGQAIPEQIGTCRIAQIDSGFFFISQHISDFLFAPKIETSSIEFAHSIIEKIKPVANPIYLAQSTTQSSITITPYDRVLQQAAILAHFLLMKIHGVLPRQSPDETLIPTSFPDGNTFHSHPDAELSTLLSRLDQNPDQLQLNVLGYEMYACLPQIRVDAISLHIRNYGEHHMNIQLVIPYYSTFDYRGFCILQPYFQASDAETDRNIAQIYHAMPTFFKAIEDIEKDKPKDAQFWKNNYKPKRLSYPQSFIQNVPVLAI